MPTSLNYLIVEDERPAVMITMNRPQQRNALSTGLMREMTEQLEEQSARPAGLEHSNS